MLFEEIANLLLHGLALPLRQGFQVADDVHGDIANGQCCAVFHAGIMLAELIKRN